LKDKSLFLCEHCGKEISGEVESCPHCGKYLESSGCITRFLFAICHPVVALIVGLLCLIVGIIFFWDIF